MSKLIPLEVIVPHRAPMLLLDEIKEYDKNRLVTYVRITEKSFGFSGNGVPGWFGLEYMAQAIAAYSGLHFSERGRPRIGFLVGVRNYTSTLEEFCLGSQLEISVEPSFVADNSGSFVCKILMNENLVAEATLITYQPTEVELKKFAERMNE